MTEVWFRNPDNYIKEIVEVGQDAARIAWDRGYLTKRRIDPVKHASLYFGNAIQYRALMIGGQGSAEYRNGDPFHKPTAVYPTWLYGEELALLETMLEHPAGQDMVMCNDKSVPPDERPVWGQEHRVIISDIPNVSSGIGRKFLTVIKTLQEDYPEAIIHIHGLYGFRAAFGMGFSAADCEPRTSAAKGKVYLPSGKEIRHEQTIASADWVTLLGFKPADLAVPRNRCMYNIKSALWAGANYTSMLNFRTKPSPAGDVDTESSDKDHKVLVNNRSFLKNGVAPKEGDRFACDSCSLQLECKHYRNGAVCSLPDAEPKELAEFFKTRDSEMILDGLGLLVTANTRRLQRGLHEEAAFGDLSPEVTKLMGQVFDQGTKLAKLIDPGLRGGAKVQVNVGHGGTAGVMVGDPRQLVARVMRDLESQGIPRDQITSDMVKGVLEGMANPGSTQRAIEGTVIAARDERAS